MSEYHGGNHMKFMTQYHIVLCPKFRYRVFTAVIHDQIVSIFQDVCSSRGYILKEIEVMPDHVHIFTDIPCAEAPSEAIRKIKSQSTVMIFRSFPYLKTFYRRCGKLWADGSFVSSVGYISEDAVRKYIQEQNRGR